MTLFKGSGVALITPFKNGKVNFEKLKEILNWHVESGTDAIIVCGTTGEASTMTEEERKETIKFTVDVINHRIPVIAGTGSNNTSSAINMSKWAESVGVDGVLVITPYYNKTTQKGILEHFKAINDAINVPIILYNVPSRTGLNITPNTLLKLCHLKNVVAIKEASGDFSQIAAMKALCGDKIDFYSGNDDQIIPLLSLGGAGVISVAANIYPTEVHNMCDLYMNGKHEQALKLQLDMLNVINALFIETNPIPIKTAMNLMEMNVGNLRLPLCDMEDSNLKILKEALENYKSLLKED
ncbi:4-hydroxy-tetrahydrodipicolinate synthase [Clostridium botulinum]|uniref:4-hydroxy-tetrahydrodipicolinate synthase n=1 Tax=Clostridium botulinum D str. 1873 TaxID=592027 RepID=A0A9P2LLT1_CLOBO|nr:MULTISPECIES: 4-hydroxy-tetrahydrodipicolinate synthase [Clostridium]EES91837.1 dihydrodipicolinate synthase [Clostridium botulinum D str. 1873]MBO3441465.1 4-hydroxy-tetrahydrodipicolinate synthase [Clostridium haemolyticum]MCD3245050.1 4-hydroxy-tetrahydrodipicolinate synthase [Clostridium botulinum C]MCD3260879.1 4-hydroxy-tetrahydrodipicolinate synthase [Clostridium botulinum C]NFV46407.1 4-hydroxy-tetrahydrodipicolinate synthase [Clostridium botulinum]